VKTEFRGFPFIGEDSVKAYRFLLAAAEQDKLWNLAEALYRNQGGENSGWVTDDLIRGIARRDPRPGRRQALHRRGAGDIRQAGEGAEAAATAAGIEGTPSFLIAVGNEQPYQSSSLGRSDARRARRRPVRLSDRTLRAAAGLAALAGSASRPT
jgi:protein-disulfide isomerase